MNDPSFGTSRDGQVCCISSGSVSKGSGKRETQMALLNFC